MIAIHKRSGMRHLVHKDRIATCCGRILHRRNWRVMNAGHIDCQVCKSAKGK